VKARVEAILGIQGVHPNENPKAVKVGNFFSYLVNIFLILVVIQLLTMWIDPTAEKSWEWVDEAVWLVFALEFGINISLVDKKWRYFRNNWLNFIIVVLAAPIFKWEGNWVLIVRSLRLVLFVRVIFNLFDVLSKILTKNSFGVILLVALLFLLLSAVIFSLIEGRSISDALWYALVTITTVGYGDIVPKTDYGREFGAVMIIFGVVLFSIVTANISAFLVGQDQQRTEHEILDYVRKMSQRMIEQERINEEHIARILSHVTVKIEDLEGRLKSFNAQKIEQELAALKQEIKEFSGEQLSQGIERLEDRVDDIEKIQRQEILIKLEALEQRLADLRYKHIIK